MSSPAVSCTSFIMFSALFFPTLSSASFPYFSMFSCILSNIGFLTLHTLLIPSSQNPSPSPLMIPPCFSWQNLPAWDSAPLSFFTAAFPTSMCEIGVGCGLMLKTEQAYIQEELGPLCSHMQGVPFVILKWLWKGISLLPEMSQVRFLLSSRWSLVTGKRRCILLWSLPGSEHQAASRNQRKDYEI